MRLESGKIYTGNDPASAIQKDAAAMLARQIASAQKVSMKQARQVVSSMVSLGQIEIAPGTKHYSWVPPSEGTQTVAEKKPFEPYWYEDNATNLVLGITRGWICFVNGFDGGDPTQYPTGMDASTNYEEIVTVPKSVYLYVKSDPTTLLGESVSILYTDTPPEDSPELGKSYKKLCDYTPHDGVIDITPSGFVGNQNHYDAVGVFFYWPASA